MELPMTSPVLAPSRREPRGFTLTEIVVVVGILLILAGILLPMGMKAYSNAGRARDAADLQAIAVALDAYKADMGDYPRLPPARAFSAKRCTEMGNRPTP